MAINYNNDIIVTKNSSKKAMECLENFVIKVNVMFSGAMAASINLNVNSMFKILIPCNYCSLAAGGGSSVRAPLLHALSSGQGILSSLLSPSVPRFMPQSHCRLGPCSSRIRMSDWYSFNWQSGVLSRAAPPACHILIALVPCSQTRPGARW